MTSKCYFTINFLIQFDHISSKEQSDMDLLEEKSLSQLALANSYKYFIQETNYELYKTTIRDDINGFT